MFYRRKLPHWHEELSEDAFLFVTWRLAGSLPRIRLDQDAESAPKSAGQVFVALDRVADRALVGPVWLRDSRIATLVAQALRRGDHARNLYELRAWCIMPNHVHLVLRPRAPLAVITRWLKGSTARKANLVLARTGQAFWQDESFDHRVRDEAELDRIVMYVENNPVAAGFVTHSRDWPWSTAGWQAEAPAPLRPNG
jgi:REP element-mobilizing transposase RayT